VEGTILLNRGSVSLINASVIFKAPDEKYSITLGGTNLTDKRYLTAGSAIPASGVIAGTYSRPREWYARVGFKF
jgi:iron complex outermembrane recepter protein